jgi:ATP-binding cassette subfamily B protein
MTECAGQPRADANHRPQRAPVAFLTSYVWRRPWSFATLFTLIVAAAGCAVAVQYGMKLIVDTMAGGDRRSSDIWRWLALFIGLIGIESVLWRVAGWLGCRTIVSTGVDVRLDLFRHLAGHSMGYFSGRLAGSLGNRVTSTSNASTTIFSAFVWKMLPPIVDFIGAVVVLWSIDLHKALALVGFVLIAGLTVLRFGLEGRPLHQAFAAKASGVGGEVIDVMTNIWTVKAFSAADREYQRLAQAFGSEASAQKKSWLYLEKARAGHDVLLWAMAGGMLVWAVMSWRNGRSSTGDVVVISALTFRILHGSRDLALSLVDAAQQFGVVAETLRVVAVDHQIADRPGAQPFIARGGSISLHELHFSHASGDSVFEGLELNIPAGQRCGIVGPSGAGKSTFLGLLQRLEDVQQGSVQIDGQDVRDVQQDSLRAAIAVVPQDIALLHRTVMQNIRYGRPGASDDDVFEASRNALCDEFIRELPKGYDTVVGERGARFSGGQRQRIGIARAFLKDAQILLLDEATSALDSQAEREIQNALERLMLGRTVVAVAHRLSTVAGFDRVVVIDRGKIVEDGAPASLLASGGTYSRLWQLQSEEQTTS